MGKTTIVVGDIPGFATSRLGVVLEMKRLECWQRVASASDIDTAMKLGYKHPMGPLELSDLVGLDVRRDILNNLAESFDDPSYLPHPLLVKLVESGELGRRLVKEYTTGLKRENQREMICEMILCRKYSSNQ